MKVFGKIIVAGLSVLLLGVLAHQEKTEASQINLDSNAQLELNYEEEVVAYSSTLDYRLWVSMNDTRNSIWISTNRNGVTYTGYIYRTGVLEPISWTRLYTGTLRAVGPPYAPNEIDDDMTE